MEIYWENSKDRRRQTAKNIKMNSFGVLPFDVSRRRLFAALLSSLYPATTLAFAITNFSIRLWLNI